MDILHVAPSFATGGREMRAVTLMGMTPPGTVHHIVALDGRLDSLERCEPGTAVEVVQAPTLSGSFMQRLKTTRGFLRERRDSLLLTYNWGAIEWLFAARHDRPQGVVHHEDGFGPDEAQRQLRRRVWARRVALRSCNSVIVPSRNLFRLGRKTWKQPERRLRYLPNGVDCQRFAPPSVPSGRDAVTFGCVGRVSVEKNVILAVDALARMQRRDVRLLVVGDGAELARCKARAVDHGLQERVEFVGNVSDTAPQYRAMDAFLIPSRTEQMPLALLEAMASGLPVIGTAVGDVPSMVATSNASRIDAGHLDPAALAGSMDALAADADARCQLGIDNRAKALAEFDLEECYGAYIRTYLEAYAAG